MTFPFHMQGFPGCEFEICTRRKNLPVSDKIKRADGRTRIKGFQTKNRGEWNVSEVTIRCPHCDAALSGDSTFLGQEVGCPDCGNDFIAETDAGHAGGADFAPSESRSSGRRDFKFDPAAFKRGGAKPAENTFPEQGQGAASPASRRREANDSVFTKTELNIFKSVIPRQQPSKSAGSSGSGVPASVKKTVPLAGRKKKSFDHRFGLETPRIFTLTSWFWTFFFLGVLVFSLGVFTIFDASGYDGTYKNWGNAGIRRSDMKKKWEASAAESSYATAKNTAALCEGMECINQNIGNIGSHYQGLHEMFIGFTLIFGSGFFFFCALISFLYSATLPAASPAKDAE